MTGVTGLRTVGVPSEAGVLGVHTGFLMGVAIEAVELLVVARRVALRTVPPRMPSAPDRKGMVKDGLIP